MPLFDPTQPFAAVVIAPRRTLVWLGVRYLPGASLTMPTPDAEVYAAAGVVLAAPLAEPVT